MHALAHTLSLAPLNQPTHNARPHSHPSTNAGRLNVLANVVRKPMAQIFSEFSGKKLKGPEG
jgi:hypothetical protein